MLSTFWNKKIYGSKEWGQKLAGCQWITFCIAWTTSVDMDLFLPNHFKSDMCSWDFFALFQNCRRLGSRPNRLVTNLEIISFVGVHAIKMLQVVSSVDVHENLYNCNTHVEVRIVHHSTAKRVLFLFHCADSVHLNSQWYRITFSAVSCSEMIQKLMRHAPSHTYPKCLNGSV